MRNRLIVLAALPVVAAVLMAGRVYQEASAAVQQTKALPTWCASFGDPALALGPKAHPFEVNSRGGVICRRRVLWIKWTACLTRYGSSRDPTPFVAACKSGQTALDDRAIFVVRHKCRYTTFEYLWLLEIEVQARSMSGKIGKGTDYGWPLEARCF